MRVYCARTLEELDVHAEAWDRLAYTAPQRTPMLSHAWVGSYLEHLLKPGERWFCLFAFEGEELLGVLPVVASPARLPWQGKWNFHAPSDLDVPTGDMLAKSGREREIVAALFAEFERLEPAYASLKLNKLPPGSPSLSSMEDEFGRRRVLTEQDGCTSILRIEGSHEAYLKSLSSNFRDNLRKSRNRLARLGRLETRFLTGEAITDEHMRRFFELEASGWKGQGGSAILSCERHTAFFTALARRLHARGMLEWHFLELDGKLIAGHLAARTDRKLTNWKIAYDEEYARYGPGNILKEQLIRRAYSAGDTDEIDLVHAWPWHANWRVEVRPYSDLIISSPRLAHYLGSLASIKAHEGFRLLRSYVKKSPALSALAYRCRDLIRGVRPG